MNVIGLLRQPLMIWCDGCQYCDPVTHETPHKCCIGCRDEAAKEYFKRPFTEIINGGFEKQDARGGSEKALGLLFCIYVGIKKPIGFRSR